MKKKMTPDVRVTINGVNQDTHCSYTLLPNEYNSTKTFAKAIADCVETSVQDYFNKNEYEDFPRMYGVKVDLGYGFNRK